MMEQEFDKLQENNDNNYEERKSSRSSSRQKYERKRTSQESDFEKNVFKNRRSSSSRSGSKSRDRGRNRSRSRSYSRDKVTRNNYKDGNKGYYKRYDDNKQRIQGQKGSGGKQYNVGNNFNSNGNKKKRTKVFIPTLEGNLCSYRYFMECQPDSLDREKAEILYNNYKKDWEKKQAEIFYGEHKNEEWFLEKYDPILSEKLRDERKEASQRAAEDFFQKFQNDYYEGLNLEIDQETLQKYQKNQLSQNKDGDQWNEEQQQRISYHQEIFMGEDADIHDAPYFGFDPNDKTLFIKSIPKNISRWDIKETLQKVPGFVSLSLSEPLKSQDFTRFGWILFDSLENSQKASEYLNNMMIKNYTFTIVKSRTQLKPIRLVTKLDKQRIQQDIEKSRQLIEALDNEKQINQNVKRNPIFEQTKFKSDLYQLDIQILYLRRVHSYCFYSSQEFCDERMLSAKCGAIILRFKIESDDLITIPDWHDKVVETVNKRIEMSQQKQSEYPVEFQIGEQVEQALTKKAAKKAIDKKWPCLFCDKCFIQECFVIKHIKLKHEEDLSKERQRVIENLTLENYINDRNKISGGTMQSGSQTQGGYKQQHQFNPQSGGHQRHQKYQQYHKQHNFVQKKSFNENRDYQDLDDPQKQSQSSKVNVKSLVNYFDI